MLPFEGHMQQFQGATTSESDVDIVLERTREL